MPGVLFSQATIVSQANALRSQKQHPVMNGQGQAMTHTEYCSCVLCMYGICMFYYFVCVWVFCFALTSVYHMHVWYILRPEKGDRSPRDRITNVCKPPCGS